MVITEQMKQRVQEQMPLKRWMHTLGVMESSRELAERFGADADQAELAALLHDFAKYWSVDRQRQAVIDFALDPELLAYDSPLWHSHIGAHLAEHEFGIDNDDILSAIRYHTSGRAGMSLLEKVVCLADYIEPGRSFEGVHEMRDLAKQDINAALLAGFDNTMHHLIQQGRKIFPQTLAARNDLIDLNR